MVVQLLPASFKGFQFLIRSVRTNGGQKTASHEYPGSSQRSIQDLGQRPDTFTVSAIIHGANYIADVARLKQILSEGDFGDFVHPSQGTFRVKATGFSLVEEDSDKGRAKFEISFSSASPEVQPIGRRSNVGAISRQAETVKAGLKNRIVSSYKVDPGLTGNFTDAVSQVREISDAFLANAGQFTPDLPGLAAFRRTVSAFSDNAEKLVLKPLQLADDLFEMFDVFDGIQATSGNSFRELIGFFSFGDDDTPTKDNTFGLLSRTTNRNVLRSSVQAGALADGFREASLISFDTQDDIESVSNTLEDQYQKTKRAFDDNVAFASMIPQTQVQDNTALMVLTDLADLRDLVRKLFNDQRLTSAQIIEIDLPVLPAIVQAQALYGDQAQDRVAQLIEINNVKDTNRLGGRGTRVLTA